MAAYRILSTTTLRGVRSLSFSYPAPRTLKDITKLPLLVRESPDSIKKIWTDFHAQREDTTSIVLTKGEFELLAGRSKISPMYIFPVRRDNGFFVLLSQWQDNHCIFTFLEDYKRNPSTAQPYLAITLYQELLPIKGIVLVRGDIAIQHLQKLEGERLLHLLKDAYLGDRSYRMVDTFNNRPNEFDMEAAFREVP